MRRIQLKVWFLVVTTGGSLTWGLVLRETHAADASPSQPQPPLPLISATTKSPVQLFRDLLAMSSAQRAVALASKTPENRRVVEEKLREYLALSPDDRELRLRLLQLRWNLMPLLYRQGEDRARAVANLPEEDRALVTDRLQQWDKLSPALQREFLENEATLSYLLRLEQSTPEQKEAILRGQSSDQRREMERKLAEWQALPPERRRVRYEQFRHFLDLTEQEKGAALRTLSREERQQMARSLQAFEGLSPERRQHCLESFRRFASMSVEERDQFLRNAERWQAMSPGERDTWRRLVQAFPPVPPLPPGLLQLPPLPRGGALHAQTNTPP